MASSTLPPPSPRPQSLTEGSVEVGQEEKLVTLAEIALHFPSWPPGTLNPRISPSSAHPPVPTTGQFHKKGGQPSGTLDARPFLKVISNESLSNVKGCRAAVPFVCIPRPSRRSALPSPIPFLSRQLAPPHPTTIPAVKNSKQEAGFQALCLCLSQDRLCLVRSCPCA